MKLLAFVAIIVGVAYSQLVDVPASAIQCKSVLLYYFFHYFGLKYFKTNYYTHKWYLRRP